MSKLTRRQFLEDSLLTAAAAAAIPAIPLPAQDGGKSAGPNDRLRVACVGVRGRGRTHVTSFARMKDVQVSAICDPDENVIGEAMKAAEKRGGYKPQYYKDVRKLLEDKSIDAISVATPNHWHVLASLWGIQAGKDVYVEKPLGQNLWECRKLVEAARKYDRMVQQGNYPRSMKGVREAIAFLQSGKLGKVKLARGLCYNRRRSIRTYPDSEPPAGVDYNLWLGPAPERPFNRNRFHYNWHWNWEYGNGELGNNGIYQMDLTRWGLGKDVHPRTAISLGGRLGYEDQGQTPNTQITWLDYGDVQVVHEIRGLETDPYRKVKMGNIFDCEKGYLVFVHGRAVAYGPDGEEIASFAGGGDHFRVWVDAVKSRRREDLTAEVEGAHLSTALCHLGNISYRLGSDRPLSQDRPFGDSSAANEAFERFRHHLKENGVSAGEMKIGVGKTLTFDSKSERFMGDDAANALLRRKYRKPFVVPETV